MNTLKLLLAMATIFPLISCNAQTSVKEANASGTPSEKIEAYYFHFSTRCVTCRSIEAQAKDNLEALYPDLFKQGLMTFQSVNLEEPANKPLVQKLGVGGQALLLVKGDQKIDLTREGFMYAMVKPEKFKEIINEKVNDLLTR